MASEASVVFVWIISSIAPSTRAAICASATSAVERHGVAKACARFAVKRSKIFYACFRSNVAESSRPMTVRYLKCFVNPVEIPAAILLGYAFSIVLFAFFDGGAGL